MIQVSKYFILRAVVIPGIPSARRGKKEISPEDGYRKGSCFNSTPTYYYVLSTVNILQIKFNGLWASPTFLLNIFSFENNNVIISHFISLPVESLLAQLC